MHILNEVNKRGICDVIFAIVIIISFLWGVFGPFLWGARPQPVLGFWPPGMLFCYLPAGFIVTLAGYLYFHVYRKGKLGGDELSED